MRQMNKIVAAVCRLFDSKDEMLLAMNSDEQLFYAALDFYEAINDFERTERMNTGENRNAVDNAYFKLTEQNKHRMDVVVSEYMKMEEIRKKEEEKRVQLIKQGGRHIVRPVGAPSPQPTKQKTLSGRIECTCGGYKRCIKCYGSGWIDPENPSPETVVLPPIMEVQPKDLPSDTWGTRQRRMPRGLLKSRKPPKQAKQSKTEETIKNKEVSETKSNARAEASNTKLKKDGIKKEIPVTYVTRKKLVTQIKTKQKPNPKSVAGMEKPVKRKSTFTKSQQNKAGKKR